MNANGIALIVEEAPAGQFYWVLQQQQRLRASLTGSVERAPRPMPTYGLAIMAGITALEKRTGMALGRQGQRVSEHATADFGPTTIAGTL